MPFCFALVTNNGRGGPRFRIHCTSCHWRALFFGTCYQHKLVKAQAAASSSHEPRLTRVLPLASKSVPACPFFCTCYQHLVNFRRTQERVGKASASNPLHQLPLACPSFFCACYQAPASSSREPRQECANCGHTSSSRHNQQRAAAMYQHLQGLPMPLQLSVFPPGKSLHLNDTERYRHFCPPL